MYNQNCNEMSDSCLERPFFFCLKSSCNRHNLGDSNFSNAQKFTKCVYIHYFIQYKQLIKNNYFL